MAAMLRVVGQASKQSSQVLTPVALNSRCLATVVSEATPRTPRTPSCSASDCSPMKRGQAASPFFANQDASPERRRSHPASPEKFRTSPSCSGVAPERSPYLSSLCEHQNELHDAQTATASSSLLGVFDVADEKIKFRPLPVPDTSDGKPTLLAFGRLGAHASATQVQDARLHAGVQQLRSDPQSVREAVLSRQSRIAERVAQRASAKEREVKSQVLLGREVDPQPLPAGFQPQRGSTAIASAGADAEISAAQLAHEAFKARMASRSGRRAAARM